MQLPQIQSNKSFIGLCSQTAEYAICIGRAVCMEQGLSWAGVTVSLQGLRLTNLGQSARNLHRHLVFLCSCAVVAYSSEYFG